MLATKRSDVARILTESLNGALGVDTVEVISMAVGSLIVGFSVQSSLSPEAVNERIMKANITALQTVYSAESTDLSALSVTSAVTVGSSGAGECGTKCIAMAVTGSVALVLAAVVVVEYVVRRRWQKGTSGTVWTDQVTSSAEKDIPKVI